MLKKVLCIILAAVPIGVSAANDIEGIRIGVPLGAPKEVIAKINPRYKITEHKIPVIEYLSFSAYDPSSFSGHAKPEDMFSVDTDNEGIVWFVGRIQTLAEDSRIKQSDFIASLIEKFGPYTKFEFEEGSRISGEDLRFSVIATRYHPYNTHDIKLSELWWYFDESGKLFQGKNLSEGPCYVAFNKEENSHMFYGKANILNDVMVLPVPYGYRLPSECGIQIRASFLRDPADDMVFAYSVQIIDAKKLNIMRDRIRKVRQLEVEKEKAAKSDS